MSSHPKSLLGSFVLVVGLGLGAAGCTVHADAEPVAYVDEDPVNVYAAPHYVYGGRTVYYVGDRWYYRDGRHWAYYRREPAELYRRRSYVREAPPARGEERREHREHEHEEEHR